MPINNDINWIMSGLWARIVVNVVTLFLNISGIYVDYSAIANAIKETRRALLWSSAFQKTVQAFFVAWAQAGGSIMKKGLAIIKLLLGINAAGFLWMIIKCLCGSITKWALLKLSAMIAITFGPGGLALAVKIASAVPTATELVTDIAEAITLLQHEHCMNLQILFEKGVEPGKSMKF